MFAADGGTQVGRRASRPGVSHARHQVIRQVRLLCKPPLCFLAAAVSACKEAVFWQSTAKYFKALSIAENTESMYPLSLEVMSSAFMFNHTAVAILQSLPAVWINLGSAACLCQLQACAGLSLGYVHRYTPDGQVAWAILASHNLSKAAWGELQHSSGSLQLLVRSYEMVVLFIPELEL